MLKSLITRRFIGFIIAAVVIAYKPEVAPYIAGIYTALIGATVADTLKGNG